MRKQLLLLSFVEGGAVMAAELCGARLLAPVFGSSLYVWASVMGITLAALAMGYFFGGYFSTNQTNRSKRLFGILMVAALFVMAMPVISHYLVPRISYLPFLVGVVLSSFTLLFLPVFFLGATSPFFISMQSTDLNDAGKVSGTVYAVSTLGGIVATFLCGFWLVPQIGLNACLLSFGLLLFVLTLIVSKTFKAVHTLILVALVYLTGQLLFKKQNQLLNSDGLLGHLEVTDERLPNGDTLRYLAINGIIQSEFLLHQPLLYKNYLALFDTLVPINKTKNKALVLGLGGGLSANILSRKKYKVEAVELDKRIIEAARNYFFLDRGVSTYDEDARYYLNHCSDTFEIVMCDVFKAEEQPGHVLTSESLNRLKKNLSSTSRLIINWHGYLSDEEGRGTAVLYNTLVQSGFNVKICSLSQQKDFRNLLFVASLTAQETLPYEINEQAAVTDLLNTDDLPRLEKLNALANKKWRANYLRYYQQKE
ncbi:MAG: fused MFS/spermidine synthase [Bacteroidia bacterium]|nr:fused MFS/spermidine synthase [Bacteroidia bacterium]